MTDIIDIRLAAVDLAIRATPRIAPFRNDSGDHIDRVMEAARKIEVYLVEIRR